MSDVRWAMLSSSECAGVCCDSLPLMLAEASVNMAGEVRCLYSVACLEWYRSDMSQKRGVTRRLRLTWL